MRHGRTSLTNLLNYRNVIIHNKALIQSYATTSTSPLLNIKIEHGLPSIQIPLPSRQESCQFIMRPLSDTIGSLADSLKKEDGGIDHVSIYGKDGIKFATTTTIEHLLQFGQFRLRINDNYFDVNVPSVDVNCVDSERVRQLDDLRATVASLYASLCVDDYKLRREKKLLIDLENAEAQLKPLQEEKNRIEKECEAHTERVMLAGFAAMGIQTGLFARLTWWEYSWDIMEPVTYFATYSTVVATFGYYLYTKQNFEYPLARERVYTKQFYRRAQKCGFDIDRYNELFERVEQLREQLNRIRDPLYQHLPVSHLTKFD